MSNRDLEVNNAKHLGSLRCLAVEFHSWRSSSGDLDVFPWNASPTSEHRLHDRFFACEAFGRIVEPVPVGPFVVGETATPESLRIASEEMPHSRHFSQIDPKPNYFHTKSVPRGVNHDNIRLEQAEERFGVRHGNIFPQATPERSAGGEQQKCLFDGHALCEVARLIDVVAAHASNVIREQLQRHDRRDRGEEVLHVWDPHHDVS